VVLVGYQLAAFCPCRLRVPGIEESFVHGALRAEYAMHHCPGGLFRGSERKRAYWLQDYSVQANLHDNEI